MSADGVLLQDHIMSAAGAVPGIDAYVDEGADVEVEEGAEEQAGPVKKKRIIKARQSLAEKASGTTLFPLSRIKRIIKADKELDMMTGEATFLVAVATEHFIKHFMEEGYTKARLEKRRIVNYKDMAAVVSRSAEFDFLRDIVPSPIPMSEALALRRQKLALDDNPTLHEDPEPTSLSSTGAQNDQLPPLALSTNPLFPNAIVKRPSNTHARGPVARTDKGDKEKSASEAAPSEADGIEDRKIVEKGASPSVKNVKLTGKNAPSTPHGLTTRAARRSMAHDDEAPATPATPTAAAATDVDGDVHMA
ncbi:hypothetical protein Q5752_000099 [Cryptotrichosporon argae]